MKKAWIIMLLVLANTLFFFCGEKKQSIEDLFSEAQKLQKMEKYSESIQIFRKIIKETDIKDQAAKAQFMIGFVYSENIKDLEKAKEAFETFIVKYPDSDSSLLESAKWELDHMGKDLDTLPIFEDSAQSEPTN